MDLRKFRDSAGASLPNRLMILLAVPLLAVGIVTTIQASGQIRVADRSETIKRLVADVAAVDAARRSVETEIVPSLATLQYQQLSGSTQPKLRQQALAVQKIAGQLPRVQAATNASFARSIAAGDSYTKGQLRALRSALVAMRTSPSGLPSYARWSALETRLVGVETTLLQRAGTGGLDTTTNQALSDVALVAPAAQYAGELAAAVISTTLTTSAKGAAAAASEVARTQGAYLAASARLTHGTTALAQRAADAVRISDTPDAGPGGSVPAALRNQTISLQRQRALNAVLDSTLDRATQAATAPAAIGNT